MFCRDIKYFLPLDNFLYFALLAGILSVSLQKKFIFSEFVFWQLFYNQNESIRKTLKWL